MPEFDYYEESKAKVLNNEQLAAWLRDLEDRIGKLEASLSPNVTWEVSRDEPAETESENME